MVFHTQHYGSIRGISSDKKLTQLPWFCKTKMQTYCRLTGCTGSRSEAVFSLCRLLKSRVSYTFLIFIAFLFSVLLFLSELPSGIKNKLVTKTDQFCAAQRQTQNDTTESDRVCDCWTVSPKWNKGTGVWLLGPFLWPKKLIIWLYFSVHMILYD